MSRETLDDGPAARPAAPGSAAVRDRSDERRGIPEQDRAPQLELTLEDAPVPDDGRRRLHLHRPTVVACALTAVVVALLTSVVAVVAGRAAPATRPALVGSFLPSTWSSAVNGRAPFDGRVQVVNAGTHAVELTRADVFGVRGEDLARPVVVPAGEVGTVAISVEVPCAQRTPDDITVEVRTVGEDGSRSSPQDVVLESFGTDMYSEPAGLLASACSVQGLGGTLDMDLLPDGSLALTLVGRGGEPTDLTVVMTGPSGLRVESDPAEGISLPEGGQASMTVRLAVEDCVTAFDELSTSSWLLEPRSEDLGNGWVDGWDPNVVSTAVGIAYARDCT